MSEQLQRGTVVFISYAWDSPARDDPHSWWVGELAERLVQHGVEVILDQRDLQGGQSITQFIEQSIARANVVVVVCTPRFATKADAREGGVGYEQELVTASLLANRDLRVIPILRRGDERAIPAFLRGRRAIDFRDDSPAAIEDLVHAIRGQSVRGAVPKRWASKLPLVALLVAIAATAWFRTREPRTIAVPAHTEVQATISGRVFDRETLRGIEDATVQVGVRVAKTDDSGIFHLTVPRADEFEIDVTVRGYEPSTLNVRAPQASLEVPLDRRQP